MSLNFENPFRDQPKFRFEEQILEKSGPRGIILPSYQVCVRKKQRHGETVYELKLQKAKNKFARWLQEHSLICGIAINIFLTIYYSNRKNYHILNDVTITQNAAADPLSSRIDRIAQGILKDDTGFFDEGCKSEIHDILQVNPGSEKEVEQDRSRKEIPILELLSKFGVKLEKYEVHVVSHWMKERPEDILDELYEKCYLVDPEIDDFFVRYYDQNFQVQNGIDDGGLSRQFIADLVSGLVGKKDGELVFKEVEGKFVPVASITNDNSKYIRLDTSLGEQENLSDEELLEVLGLAYGNAIPDEYIGDSGWIDFTEVKKKFADLQGRIPALNELEKKRFEMLGKLFGMCNSSDNFLIGSLFDESVFDGLCAFSDLDLDVEFNQLSDERRMEIYEQKVGDDPNLQKLFRFANSDLDDLDDNQLLESVWFAFPDGDFPDELGDESEIGDVRENYEVVRDALKGQIMMLMNKDKSLPALFMIARGLRNHIDSVDDPVVMGGHDLDQPWDLLRLKGGENLLEQIQGALTSQILIEKLNFDFGVSDTSSGFLKIWIEEVEQENLVKFVKAATGSPSLGRDGVISVAQNGNGEDYLPEFHTCTNQIVIPDYDDYDTFRQKLELALKSCFDRFDMH